MKKVIKPYFVLLWNVNKDSIEYYDIMPYLINTYKEEKKKKTKVFSNGDLSTFEGIKTFILSASKYQFWSRCQYEIVVTGFPKFKKEEKIDAYDQIKANIEAITAYFISQL